jgi:hypothetical protein
MRKLGLEVNVLSSELGNGESVRSILGLADCMLLNSAVSSVKIVACKVFNAGPAGYQ